MNENLSRFYDGQFIYAVKVTNIIWPLINAIINSTHNEAPQFDFPLQDPYQKFDVCYPQYNNTSKLEYLQVCEEEYCRQFPEHGQNLIIELARLDLCMMQYRDIAFDFNNNYRSTSLERISFFEVYYRLQHRQCKVHELLVEQLPTSQSLLSLPSWPFTLLNKHDSIIFFHLRQTFENELNRYQITMNSVDKDQFLTILWDACHKIVANNFDLLKDVPTEEIFNSGITEENFYSIYYSVRFRKHLRNDTLFAWTKTKPYCCSGGFVSMSHAVLAIWNFYGIHWEKRVLTEKQYQVNRLNKIFINMNCIKMT